MLVATSGTHDLLVSDANGPIKSGDYLSISTVSGIAQKATDEQRIVIGRALEDYVPQDGSIVLSVASDGAGGEVNLGRIAADIAVAQNPNLAAPEQDVPEFLAKAAELVSGKDEAISPVRVYVLSLIHISEPTRPY